MFSVRWGRFSIVYDLLKCQFLAVKRSVFYLFISLSQKIYEQTQLAVVCLKHKHKHEGTV